MLTPPFDDKAVSRGFKKFMLIGDLLDIPTSGLIASKAAITNQTGQSSKDHRGAGRRSHLDTCQSNRIRKNDCGQVQRSHRLKPMEPMKPWSACSTKQPIVAENRTRSLDLLRQERSVPADLDPQKFLDFSMLPAGK